MLRKILTGILTAFVALVCLPTAVSAETQSPVLTFSDSGITETASGSGYTIDGTALTITAAGVYTVTGSCSEGSIVVSKSLSNVVLILSDLTLSASTTAPLVIKKSATATIHLEGTNTLTDNEDPDDETSSDTTVADAYEGACIKVKSGSSLTFCGEGTLKINGNAKNGIKGGSTASLIFNDGTYVIDSANNGIAADGSVTINDGDFTITGDNDGIKSAPDATDESEGTTVDTESAGTITINGGTFDIDVEGDGIQADTALTIEYGVFDIKTLGGYSDSSFDKDTMSCKGLKASGDRAEEVGTTPQLTINGGTFNLNTADDAVHSDGDITITAGTFEIYTGDDGAHADETLNLGTDGGYERDPQITVNASYEGLEGSVVNIYSGKFYTVASDDGINAAGGSSNGTDPGHGGDPWHPGPGTGGDTSSYSLNIYGGDVYVDCTGDGLDSNGSLNLYGGNITVFSQARGGDNSPLDSDGTILIKGATVFAAGSNPMNENPSSSSQSYYKDTTSRNANTIVNVKSGNTVIYSDKLPRATNYLLYSNPSYSSVSVATASSVETCKSNAWNHNWDSGKVVTAATEDTAGLMVYTCSNCGKTEYQSYKIQKDYGCDGHEAESGDDEEDEGYAVTFVTDSGASINVYYTQDYTAADETNVTSTVSRNSTTGDPDSTGDGQVNFTVVLADGYSLSDLSIDGTYKNLKGPSDTGVANTYRITKVQSELTITVTTVACEHADVSNPVWTWADDYSTATLSLDCADCSQTVNIDAEISSVLGSDGKTITFTATAELNGVQYTDTQTAEAFVITFDADEHATVNLYYTKDTSEADEEDVSTAVARDGDSGYPVISGDGQVNFTVVLEDGYKISDVSVTGSYKNLKGPSDTGVANTYRITKVAGDLTVSITTAEKTGEEITLTLNQTSAEMATNSTLQLTAAVEPSDADQSVTWTSSDESVATVDENGLVTALRYGTVTITAVSAADTSVSASCEIQTRFYDVNDTSLYYYNPVYWAAENGITMGYDKVYFGPQRTCTRRELAIFLWRLAGKPEASGSLPFSDTGSYAQTSDTYKAILWCYQNGIVRGYDDGTFKPDASVIRKDTMIMLYRLAGKPDVSGTMAFADVAAQNYDVNSDTYKSIIWGTELGITKGYSDGSFKPFADCLREHIVTFIYRYDQNYNQ